MVQPYAPAAFAAALTAIIPGIRGPRTGSMITSESNDDPMRGTSPVKMPATCSASGTGKENTECMDEAVRGESLIRMLATCSTSGTDRAGKGLDDNVQI